MHFTRRVLVFAIFVAIPLPCGLRAAGDLANGVVTFAEPGKLYLRTEKGGQLVIWNGKPVLRRGDRVEAEGQWTPAKFKDALRADWVRIMGHDGPVEPRALPVRGPWNASLESDLASVEARVLDSLTTDAEILLYCVSDGRPFQAVMKLSSDFTPPPRIAPGSLVRLTGLCDLLPVDGPPNRIAKDFQLRLRDPKDVQVMARPPWWTPERLLALLTVLCVVVAAASAWLILLRRRVEIQTKAIGEHVARAAVHEDRQRIARELHDTLEQELTGLRLQIETANVQIEATPDAARAALKSAATMLARSQRETRETLLDLREESRPPEGGSEFVAAVRERLETRCDAAGVELKVSCSGSEQPFGRQCMHHLLRITTEAVTNALKHAQARHIDVLLAFEPDELTIHIADDGVGCEPSQLDHPPVGHFGLRGMRERAAKFGGSLHIHSAPGAGTQIKLTIPYD